MLSEMSVVHSPVATARRRHVQVEPVAVTELVRLVATLGRFDRDNRQRPDGISIEATGVVPSDGGMEWLFTDPSEMVVPQKPRKTAIYGTFWDALGRQPGDPYGHRSEIPVTLKASQPIDLEQRI